jgi:hypothetical protein
LVDDVDEQAVRAAWTTSEPRMLAATRQVRAVSFMRAMVRDGRAREEEGRSGARR